MDRLLGSSKWPSLIAVGVTLVACAKRPTTAEPSLAKATPAAETDAPAPPEPIVELPRTPVGQLARALVDVINSGKAS